MQITTTYFHPMEIKKFEYYDQPQADSVYYALSFNLANCSTCRQLPKLQMTYTYSITAYCGYSLRAHVHALTFSSANYSV